MHEGVLVRVYCAGAENAALFKRLCLAGRASSTALPVSH